MKFHERLKQTRKRRYGAKEGDEEEDPKPKGPNCHNCVSFEITWDFKFPYGCKAMGFKTRKIPAMEVYEASGFHCQKFQSKNKKK